MDIKEEFCDVDSCSENVGDTKGLVKKVKIETVTNSSDIKPEFEGSTCSGNDKHHLMRVNESIKESETEIKIDITEENWWLKSEDSCINGGIKDETHEDFYSTKPTSLYKQDVSSYTSHSFSSEDLGNDIGCNMSNDGPEGEGDRKCKSQKGVVTDICSQDLETPKLYHEGIKPHKCNICNKAFTELSHLKTHKLIHDGIKPHKCNICSIAFTWLSSLKRHKLVHEGIKPHKCGVCNKAFTVLSNFKRHKLVHENIKPHRCNICNKTFALPSCLNKHKLIHEGIKSHKCNVCNKAFAQLSNLKMHKLIHEEIKLHKCYVCNKAFTQLSNLKTHKLIHDGIKSHKCNICNKAFTQLSGLKRHILSHRDKYPQ